MAEEHTQTSHRTDDAPGARPPLWYSSPGSTLGWRALKHVQPSLTILLWAAVLVVATWVPLAFALRGRSDLAKTEPRVHFIQDMDTQPKLKAQQSSPLFADGRSNRPPVIGAVSRNETVDADAFTLGFTGAAAPGREPAWVDGYPEGFKIDLATLKRGQATFNMTCALCHGPNGLGNGPIHLRATAVGAASTGWVQPTSMLSDQVRQRPNGHLYNTINYGIRTMAGYGHQIAPHDRWAVVAYVRALQATDGVPASAIGTAASR